MRISNSCFSYTAKPVMSRPGPGFSLGELVFVGQPGPGLAGPGRLIVNFSLYEIPKTGIRIGRLPPPFEFQFLFPVSDPPPPVTK